MAKKKMYTFSEHRHSRKGITSTILGGISLVLFVVLAYIAWWSYGEGGTDSGLPWIYRDHICHLRPGERSEQLS